MKVPEVLTRPGLFLFVLLSVLLFAAAGGAMVIFLILQTAGTALIWPDTVQGSIFILILTTAGGILVALCLSVFGDHVGLLQQTIAEFQKSGRIEPRYLTGGLLAIYLSLIFGASLGPEVAAIDIGGSMGTWMGDRVRSMYTWMRALAIVGISGSLGGFGVFLWITRTTGGALYPLPPYEEFMLLYLLYAAVLGLVGAAAGIAFIYSYRLFRHLTASLSERPLIRGAVGGLGLGLAGVLFPIVLFSGQTEFQTILNAGAGMGAAVLMLIVGTKILASTWCMATIFKGGPIFPLLFAGGTLGLTISLLFPSIPIAVAVPATMAGMIVCVLKMPLGVIPLVAIFFLQWDIVSFVILATLAGYYATRHITMLPGQALSGEGKPAEIRRDI